MSHFDFVGVGETMALFTPVHSRILSPRATCIADAAGAESNVARSLALMGARSAWVGALGEDLLGALVLQSLADDGVDVSLVARDSQRPTGAIFKSAGAGDRGVQYLRHQSAGSHFGEVAFARALQTKTSVLHVSGVTTALSDTGRALTHEIVRKDRNGGRVSFDVNFRPSLWGDDAGPVLLEIARAADIVFVGQDEAQSLWGIETHHEVRRLLPSVPTLVVKDGAHEVTTYSGDDVFVAPTPRREVAEAVGAGDAFAAGWILGTLMGHDPLVAMQMGHNVAGVVLSSPLDTPSAEDLLNLPRWENHS